MEEINKRFAIIRDAIELSDYDVIEMQIKRLSNLSSDKHLHEILNELENRNFRQAIYGMDHYGESIKDDFFDNTPANPKHDDSLFDMTTSDSNKEERIMSVDDMFRMTKESAKAPRGYSSQTDVTTEKTTVAESKSHHSTDGLFDQDNTMDDDPLFSLDKEPVAEDFVEEKVDTLGDTEAVSIVANIDNSEYQQEDIALDETPLFTDEILDDSDDVSSFVEDSSEQTEVETEPEPEISDSISTPPEEMFDIDLFGAGNDDEDGEVYIDAEDNHITSAVVNESKLTEEADDSDILKETPATSVPTPKKHIKRAWDYEPDEDEKLYEKFAFMDKKFRNMLHQYPQVEESEDGIYDEVEDFIEFVKNSNYSESQVEVAIKRYLEMKQEGRTAYAAQMLLAAATTESTFAQFMLARELFKGDVLKQDYAEAFTQINKLAEEDYPEAICDLGQLYEYGIGIDKNKKHAMLLYEEAAEMGIERANKHYERLKNDNPVNSILSTITSSINSLKDRKRK